MERKDGPNREKERDKVGIRRGTNSSEGDGQSQEKERETVRRRRWT